MIIGFAYDAETGEIEEWHLTPVADGLDIAPIAEEEVRRSLPPSRLDQLDVALVDVHGLDWRRLAREGTHGYRIDPDTRQYEPKPAPADAGNVATSNIPES